MKHAAEVELVPQWHTLLDKQTQILVESLAVRWRLFTSDVEPYPLRQVCEVNI